MLPDSILPTPEDDIARILANFEKRISHLERLESGGLGLGARVFNSANISIPNNVFTALTFDSEDYDNDDIHSTVLNTSRLTATTPGKYLIQANLAFALNTTGNRWGEILLNGATRIAIYNTGGPVSNGAQEVTPSVQDDLAEGDFVEVRVHQDSGGALNIITDAENSPYFMMMRIG